MAEKNLLEKYNYDSFIPENFEQWMRFEDSPKVGSSGLDFPLWNLDEEETSLSEIWEKNAVTIVEFGSFT
ncbi:MAG: hypothetical protein N2D54_02585 [Chloroflexota bacterium]